MAGPGAGTLFHGFIGFRRYVTFGLKDFLVAYTARPIEVVMTPTESTDASVPASIPYSIIYPISSFVMEGTPLDYPEEMMSFRYQITSAGETPEQAEKMADMIRMNLVGKNADGSFLHSFTLTNITILNRAMIDGPGPIRGSDKLYYVDEDFNIYIDSVV
jgi:hypothetical protein